jgi:hypothetical protein
VAKLVRFQHPPIGGGRAARLGPVWLDWLMILALAWSAIPSVFLGRAKLRWLLSPELVSTSYAAAEYGISNPVTRQVGPAIYQVRARNSEWVATLYLAQPIRQAPGASGA